MSRNLSEILRGEILSVPDALTRYPQESPDGLIIELGVASGNTLRIIGDAVPLRTVFGFDSFEGLPEPWHSYEIGAFQCDPPDDLPGNCKLIIGKFQDTLPNFLRKHQEPLSFLHVDCDLYSSTAFCLEALTDRLQNGTIILFDELIGYSGHQDHEYKALQELLYRTPLNVYAIGKRHPHSVAIYFEE